MNKIAITGVSSYLGRNLSIEAIKRGHNVIPLSHAQVREANLNPSLMRRLLRTNSIEQIILIGHPSTPTNQSQISKYFYDAINMPVDLVLQLKNFGLKSVVFIGSYWQELNGAGYEPINIYSASKQACENLLASLISLELNVTSFHLGDLYGPNDTRLKLIPSLVRAFRNNEDFEIENPKNILNPIWIDDVSDAILKVVEQNSIANHGFQRFSLLGPRRYYVSQILSEFNSIFRGKEELFRFKEKEVKEFPKIQSISRLSNPPSWQPKISLRVGLKRIYDYEFQTKG